MAAEPLVMVVSDRRRLGRPLEDWAREVAEAGADWLQVREKDLGDGELLALAAGVVAAVASVHGTRTRVMVNGRPDIAMLAGADGVQLPEQGLPVAWVRETFPTLVAGVSAHSAEAAAQAARDGAHLVLLGPVLRTPGKDERVIGIEPLGRAAASCAVPVYAVGGVEVASAARLVAAGARGLAATRCFTDRPVRQAMNALRAAC